MICSEKEKKKHKNSRVERRTFEPGGLNPVDQLTREAGGDPPAVHGAVAGAGLVDHLVEG